MLIKNIETLLKNRRRGAIHVGANNGGERDWYIQNEFTPVIWFEPLKEVYGKLVDHIKDAPGQIAFNFGIHDTLTTAVLNVANNEGQSSSILPFGTHATSHPKVKYIGKEVIELVRLDDFLDVHNYPKELLIF
jgi:FkbM family methyltransferase